MTNLFNTIKSLSVPRYSPRPNPLTIPEPRWDDEPLRCLKINDEWAAHLIGVINAMDEEDTWLGTADDVRDAREQVNEIILALMEVCPMDCCLPPLTRINDDGTMDVSYDGGETWTPATTEDPRNSAPTLPPVTDPEGADVKCKSANRVVRQFKDAQMVFADNLGAGLTVLQLALAFAGAVAVLFLTAGTTAAVIVPALLALAAAIVGTGATAYNDLFTDDLWGLLLCSLYCHAETDGSYTQASYLAILSDIDGFDADPNARLTLTSIMRGWQLVGLNNASRILTVDNLSCTDCPCFEGARVYVWDAIADHPTEIFPDETGLYTAPSGTSLSDGFYYCSIFFQNQLPIPAHWECWEISVIDDGGAGTPFKYRCSDYTLDALSTCSAQFTYRRNDTPFSVAFTVGDLCGAT